MQAIAEHETLALELPGSICIVSVRFTNLKIGGEYDRPFLAKEWGYKGFQAISRGVVTPIDTNYIILFVTEEKQQSLTQYKDYIQDSLLHWEGEEKHASDYRIISASTNDDQIHLFYRKQHHSPFVYMGEIWLLEHNLLIDTPSQFIFSLKATDDINEEAADYDVNFEHANRNLAETERNAISKSRIGQGVYRDGLFRLWGSCAVTGYTRPTMLLASHIKPWKSCSNKERLDPYNGLLLHPTIDRFFDKGFISFDDSGNLLKARDIVNEELQLVGVDPAAKLRMLPNNTKLYLEFHRDTIFDHTL